VKKKAIAVLSGGLDSAVALALCHPGRFTGHLGRFKGLPEVARCITFQYGQRHVTEVDHAEEIARYYNLPIEIVLLPRLHSAVLTSEGTLPLDRELDRTLGIAPTFVAHRNLVMIAVAANRATGERVNGVVGGWHGEDVSYPDCNERFLKAVEQALTLGGARKFYVWRPLVNYTKATIVKMAYTLDVPLDLTWSCYAGRGKQCGRCDACQQRIEAFKANSAIDPVPYEIDIDWEAR